MLNLPHTFVLGQDDDKAYSPGCSWQKPYPTQQREKIDKHQRPVVGFSQPLLALLLRKDGGGRKGKFQFM